MNMCACGHTHTILLCLYNFVVLRHSSLHCESTKTTETTYNETECCLYLAQINEDIGTLLPAYLKNVCFHVVFTIDMHKICVIYLVFTDIYYLNYLERASCIDCYYLCILSNI